MHASGCDRCRCEGFRSRGTAGLLFADGGSSWASYVAQSVMVGALKVAGVASSQFLHGKGPLPEADVAAFSVATDDVIAFERECHKEFVPGSVCPVLGELEAQWQ